MSDPDFFISTPRLYISYLIAENDAHCDFLVELYNSPPFIASVGGRPTSITTRESAHIQLAGRFRAEHVRNGYGTYLISLRPDPEHNAHADSPLTSATPIGTLSLMRGEEPNCYSAPDLGFAILPGYMRKGYAKEAAERVVQYAQEELGVEDVLGLHDPSNEASYAVFRSLGFENRGLRELKVFGDVVGLVWAKPGMAEDLSVYGLPRDAPDKA
ncbi:including n-acetylases of ribosomal protein [Coniochaeta ligniaria NRRL 30616]|uniref:Including n-acetylases of ribosomal protein n=1 Tax=Coniochaeta ligniaria NRRL 30616 TaxID=1408157 RepID=A0A1J7JHL2_9PEZI|nr:including n-acetylases of ribosomal protein [Coniochaeta ligniaria NRRL 30616]